jgi:hypothetical protein
MTNMSLTITISKATGYGFGKTYIDRRNTACQSQSERCLTAMAPNSGVAGQADRLIQQKSINATLAIEDSSNYLNEIVGDDGTEDLYKASYIFNDRYTAFPEWQNINDEPLEEI